METSVSFLDRLRLDRDEDAWHRLDGLYRPLILRWLRRLDPSLGHEAEDLTQEVLTVVFHQIREFQRRRSGAFRNWLYGIMIHRVKGHW